MKEVIRKDILKIRMNMPKSEVIEKSEKIKNRLFEISKYRNAQTILFYISYDNEVYTHNMIKESMSRGKTIVVPKSDKKNRKLILSELTNWKDLEVGAYNILEPKKNYIKEVSIESIDLIIVPGVVFDRNGNRIGHGMGYYDRLLKKSHNIPRIGLAFEFQIVKKIPIESHDLPVNKIITENRIINCFFYLHSNSFAITDRITI